MKLLSSSVLLGSLLIAFNYVWINRITVIKQTDTYCGDSDLDYDPFIVG